MNHYEEQQLASEWNLKFKNAMIHKAPYTKRWNMYLDAYKGDYFKNANLPDYKSDLVSNYIFSIIETIRPIMLDNDPKFQTVPRQPEGMPYSNDLQEVLLYEWDREKMSKKLYKELINTLVFGTSVFFLPWDANKKNVRAIPVNPFNIFPDPLATGVEDAEYIIYASYKNVNKLKRAFPKKASLLTGGNINYSELVQDNNRNAQIDNQVLVLEAWSIDEDVSKYPNGRVTVVCPELGIVLDDKPNPYKDEELPFILLKDYDIPNKFWGEGEVAQLISPQKYMNELNNSILDNAKATANMPWIIDKNSGIGQGKITARPGLVIRKNPGSEVRREQPPAMPMYVVNAVETYKDDMEQISGIFNTLKGDNSTGVYTAQGILALQEAGQVRIRLKVKLMEDTLGDMARKWHSRMKQYWKEDRWINISRHDGSYDLKKFVISHLQYDYDIRITAGSTMPVNRGAMLDLMIRLAQTPMPDGQNLVDREAVVEYLPGEIKSALLQRMAGKKQELAQIEQAIQQLGQQLQQLMQQLQQVTQEMQQNDQQTFDVIDEITGAIEHVNQQILQLQQKHDMIEKEKQEQEKIDKVRQESYNKGFVDAESMYQPSESGESNVGGDIQGLSEIPTLDEQGLPDDLLEGLENMSEDELALLLESNPELIDLIQ